MGGGQGLAVLGHLLAGKQFGAQRGLIDACRDPSGNAKPAESADQRSQSSRERAEHAFAADHADLELGVVDARNHRDETVDREVRVRTGITRLAEHVAERQLHRLGPREQALAVAARQQFDQAVLGGWRQGHPRSLRAAASPVRSPAHTAGADLPPVGASVRTCAASC